MHQCQEKSSGKEGCYKTEQGNSGRFKRSPLRAQINVPIVFKKYEHQACREDGPEPITIDVATIEVPGFGKYAQGKEKPGITQVVGVWNRIGKENTGYDWNEEANGFPYRMGKQCRYVSHNMAGKQTPQEPA